MEIRKTNNTNLLRRRFNFLLPENTKLWEKLTDEFNLLIGGEDYLYKLREMNELIQRMNDLNILVGAFTLMNLGSEEGVKILKAFGIDPKHAEKQIKREATDIAITKAMLDARSQGEPEEFFDIVTKVEKQLKWGLNLQGMSCSHWIYTLKNLNKK